MSILGSGELRAVFESASDTPAILAAFQQVLREVFEIYPTGVGFLLDSLNEDN